jgi:hypothetical protein
MAAVRAFLARKPQTTPVCAGLPAVDWCIVGGQGRGPPARQRPSEAPMQLKGEKLVPATPCLPLPAYTAAVRGVFVQKKAAAVT